MKQQIEVIVADDHPVLRQGLRALLGHEPDISLVAEASTGEAAANLCAERHPHILLLDLSMPGEPAKKTIPRVAEGSPDTRVIILTAYHDSASARELTGLGARGYVLKDDAPEAVTQAVRAVSAGSTWFSTGALREPGAEVEHVGSVSLTARECEIIDLLAQGHDVNGIADALLLSCQTVRNYLHTLYGKLGVTSRADAVVWAYQHGFARR